MAKTTLPTLNSNDGLLWLNDAHGKSVLETVSGRGVNMIISVPFHREANSQAANSPDTVVNVSLPLSGGDSTWLWVEDGVDTTVEMALPGGLGVTGDCRAGKVSEESRLAYRQGYLPQMIGQAGLYLERSRAVLPL